MSNAKNIKWVATLSDGSTAAEESGHWRTVPGERKPWVRLCAFAEQEGLHITSLRLNIDGRTIHMPREAFARFSLEGLTPSFYSVSHHLEVDDPLGEARRSDFISLATHFPDFTIHYVQDTNDGNNSWVVVTKPHEALAPSPPVSLGNAIRKASTNFRGAKI